MYYSRYNLLLTMKENPEFPYALLNALSGSFDLVRQAEYDNLQGIKSGTGSVDQTLVEYLLSRGYLYGTKDDEEAELARRWPEFQKALYETEPQVLLVPTYACNLACKYCYQNGIKKKTQLMTTEVADAFFEQLKRQFPEKQPFITLFGGEALNAAPRQMKLVDYIVKKAAAGGYAIAAVTNGYDLAEYLDILEQARIKEIQVTLDGPEAVHDERRYTTNGKGTYARIMAGLEETIRRKIPVNLRAVVDRSNFADLVTLAEDLDARGWLDLPASRFKTQIGRNYELFECYAAPQHLLGQAEHWALFLELAEKYPILKKFHTPEFKGISHLVQSGELYLPTYDTCPAGKTEWVFDLYGDIYGCTATTGQDDYKLGTFYPNYSLKSREVKEWQERSILTIPECRECEVGLICGGGCGAISENRQGRIKGPDCRPIKEMLTLGLQYYGDELLQMGH